MKVTATKCLENKKHKWEDINIHHNYGQVTYLSWCRVCGCRTEFFKNENMKKRERCLNEDNTLYIEIPEHLKE